MASAAQKRIKSISYAKYGYLFILPFFLIYAIFQLWPLINTFILSFYGNGNRVIGKDIMTGQDLINETHNDAFVGLDNFKAYFSAARMNLMLLLFSMNSLLRLLVIL